MQTTIFIAPCNMGNLPSEYIKINANGFLSAGQLLSKAGDPSLFIRGEKGNYFSMKRGQGSITAEKQMAIFKAALIANGIQATVCKMRIPPSIAKNFFPS